MAAEKNSTRLSPPTTIQIHLTAMQRRRLQAALRPFDITVEEFARDLLVAAASSLEGERLAMTSPRTP
jgi:hypothetical protein